MSKLKMVLMLVLLAATVVTTATTFVPRDSFTARAQNCPGPNESEGSCLMNDLDPNFGYCQFSRGGTMGS